MLDKAYQSLESMNEEEYFGVLLKLLARYALPQDGEIFFSAERSRRECLTTLKMQWRTLRGTKAEALRFPQKKERLTNGFVLAYGGIEENCTLQAMFDEKKDELSDKVYHILFA